MLYNFGYLLNNRLDTLFLKAVSLLGILKWILDISKMREYATEIFECVILLRNQAHCITLFLPHHLHWHLPCQSLMFLRKCEEKLWIE